MVKLYKMSMVIYNISYANIDNEYISIDSPAMVWLQTRAKIANCCKT